MNDVLGAFSAPVRAWFVDSFGEPTPPQESGWPPIQRGEHTLILAPTGSGKTIAAFLWAIDRIFQQLAAAEPATRQDGIRLLYVSPLKALNNDVERNLRAPLAGIRATAAHLGQELPRLHVAVRTGDTPGHARAQMLKHPPHILITTPESLYLMLTSPRARELFRTVDTVIVDEIHTLCGNKRGVHLSLTLERLERLAAGHVQRIGLSATQKPLEEVARYLGGQEWVETPVSGAPRADGGWPEDDRRLVPRPVTVVDTGYRKPLDLQVVTVVADFRDMPGDTIWPAVVARLLGDVRRRRSTLIFANNRRLAERTADRLNAQIAAEETEEIPPGSTEALAPGGLPRDRGIFAIGASGPIRAHHGSMSKEARRSMEEDLKAGRLPALVGTSSLELGIDIGVVDQVVQLESPKSVAQGLQRVGRSGHLVGQTSVGRIYAIHKEDLIEAAAVARGMIEGDVEPTYTPQNPLDVLAQQIVAMVAVEDWPVAALFGLVRQAYAYRDLSWQAFHAVLDMLSGKYYQPPSGDQPAGQLPTALRPRILWDRVHDRLAALPGSRLLAISNGGTIPDTGAYRVFLADGKTRIGELDEEFVFETRPGDVFLLGSNVWRVVEIDDDRVIVSDAAGSVPRMPFWNGDYPWRPYELGKRIGRFRGEIAERIGRREADEEELKRWLRRTYALDENSAANLVGHVTRQLDALGVMSSDTTIVAESFHDAVGEPRLVIHSPFGGRINGAWALALIGALRERTGVQVEGQANDDGIIFRFPRMEGAPPVDLLMMSPAEAKQRILHELPDSPMFGAQFRMNAGRALLMPRAHGRHRTPFWLQRLKAKDLLAIVRQFDDFPIVTETYRACLQDVLDLPHLQEVLARLESGDIRIVPVETVVPSPVAADLLFGFVNQYIYEWDAPKAERQLQALTVRQELLEDLVQGAELSDLLRADASADVEARLQRTATGYQARSVEELALFLGELGDLTTDEVHARALPDGAAWLAELAAAGRVVAVTVFAAGGRESRWVPVELAGEYAGLDGPASGPPSGPAPGWEKILRRFLRTHGPVRPAALLQRYPFDPAWLAETLAGWAAERSLVRGHFGEPGRGDEEFCDAAVLEQIRRRTLALLREEVRPVPLSVYADFLAKWQHAYPSDRLTGAEAVRTAVGQLSGVALPGIAWERDVLPLRVTGYAAADLDALCGSGELVWVGSGRDPRRGHFRLFLRGQGALFLAAEPDLGGLSREASLVYEQLKAEGASFTTDLWTGTGLSAAALEAALVELVMSGLVTNDTPDTMRHIIQEAAPASPRGGDAQPGPPESGEGRRRVSALEADLAERLAATRPLTTSRYRSARQRVNQRLKPDLRRPELKSTAPAAGRWSLVHRSSVMGRALSQDERAEKLARVLLTRCGVVARELAEREGLAVDWSLLYRQFQRMEMRGEVRRGYFVAGLAGAQFALPEAVERLRARADGEAEPLALNATDPANLYGIAAGEAGRPAGEGTLRFARVPSTFCVLLRGQPVLVAEDSGARISTPGGAALDVIQDALQAYLQRPNAARHVVVAQWNGLPVVGSSGEAALAALGFYRSPAGMERWTSR